MINGNVNEFVNNIYYGEEMFFLYKGRKYFLQGWKEWKQNGAHTLSLDILDPPSDDYLWYEVDLDPQVLVDHFLVAPLFDGKTFWEVEQEIEWLDD